VDYDTIIGGSFRGCVLVCQNDAVVYEKAFGFADWPNQIPNTPTTRFATASAGKVFVAAAILQLIEQGRLSLTDTIGDRLDIDLKQIDGSVTVEQLLTHTSGIPDYFDESVLDDYEALWADFPNYKIRTNRDLLPLFIDKPMSCPRGSRFQYNNSGYVMLALLLEHLTGQPFDRVLCEQIFIPCGMPDTGYFELDRLPARCANHYIRDQQCESWRTNIFSVDAKGTGAGGAYTTVGDIRRFWQGLLSGHLLSPAMTQDMLSRHSGEEDGYGYGIWLRQSPNGLIPYFQGSDPGVSFLSACDITRNLVVVLVSNYGDHVWRLFEDLFE
jgi:CubicO group peptidase (beta-lactamase class C family)